MLKDKKRLLKYGYMGLLCILLNCLMGFSYNIIWGDAITKVGGISGVFDSTLFHYLGMRLFNGEMPYVDFWDHKGIILFLIYSIPFLFKNAAVAAGWLSAILGAINCIIAYEFIRKIIKKDIGFIWITLMAIVMEGLYCGGYIVESLILPFMLGIVMLTLKYVNDVNNHKANRWIAFLIGLMTAIIFNIRIKEIVIAIVPFIAICYFELFKSKNYKRFFEYIGFALVGVVSIFGPVLLYFGVNGALADWFYGNVTFSIDYIKRANSGNYLGFFNMVNFDNILFTLVPIFHIIYLVYQQIKNKQPNFDEIIYILSYFACLAIIVTGFGFVHYSYILFPYFIIASVWAVDALRMYLKAPADASVILKITFIPCILIVMYSMSYFLFTKTSGCFNVIWEKDDVAEAKANGIDYKEFSEYTVEQDLIEIKDKLKTIHGNDDFTVYWTSCAPSLFVNFNEAEDEKYNVYQSWWGQSSDIIWNDLIDNIKSHDYTVFGKIQDDKKYIKDLMKDIEGLRILTETDEYYILAN